MASKKKQIQNQLDKALEKHRSGALDEAETIYREILKLAPKHHDALHLMGHVNYLKGNLDEAQKWLKKAQSALKAFPLALHTQALVYEQMGQLNEARQCLQNALKHQPDFQEARKKLQKLSSSQAPAATESPQAEGLYNQAHNLYRQGRQQEAEKQFREVIETYPDWHKGANNFAVLLLQEERVWEAMDILEKLLQRAPEHTQALTNKGLAHEKLGQLEDALAYYQKAIACNPHDIDAMYNCGNVYRTMGDNEKAKQRYRDVLSIKPDHIQSHNVLGRTLLDEKHYEEAREHFEHSLRAEPDNNYFGRLNIAILLRDIAHYEDAEKQIRLAIETDPNTGEPHNTLGWILNDMGRYQDAEQAFREGLDKDPGSRRLHSNLLMLLTYRMRLSHDRLYEEHATYGRQHKATHPEGLRSLSVEMKPYRKLRVAYMSPDYKRHVVRNFIQPVIESHNRNKVEVFCYAEVKKRDDITEIIRQRADHWVETQNMSDLEVANHMREHEIDVLIELAGHCGDNRLDVVSYRPAPVQVSYLGYITTTGVPEMDYRITDPVMTPSDSPERWTEELYTLDRCYKCYLPNPEEPPINPEVGFPGKITFGSLHRISKITEETLELWSGVMRALPDSKLLLARHELHDQENRKTITRLFEQHGVNAEQLILDDTHGYNTHMEIYRKIDIGLDPIPVVGGATTAEAIWMGVPVLTLQGDSFRERISSSLLDAMGLNEFICTSIEDYAERAKTLSQDYHKRLRLRANMRERFNQSPLGDANGLASALENAYLDMWHRYLAGQAPHQDAPPQPIKQRSAG